MKASVFDGSTLIMVVKEKHGIGYFDVSTPERLHKAAVHILKQRLKIGWYGEEKELTSRSNELIKERSHLERELELTQDDEVRAFINDRLGRVKNDFWYAKEGADFLNKVQKIINDTSVESIEKLFAWNLLYSRTDYQYERVQIEKALKPKDIEDIEDIEDSD